MGGRNWTPEEIEFIKNSLRKSPRPTLKAMGEKLGRSSSGISTLVERLGLDKVAPPPCYAGPTYAT